MKKLMMMVAALTAATAWSAVDSLGGTPKYWYTFNGKVTSQGENNLGCNWDGSYSFSPVRQGSSAWQINLAGTSGQSVFAPANSSFTIFMSVDPGNNGYRDIFTLGANADTANLGVVTLHEGRIGVTCWDSDHSSSGNRQYGILAADGVAGKLHPYALVYDSQVGSLTLYSNGIKVGSAAFEGFGGAEGSVTSFQFGSTHGGPVQPFGNVSGALLEDFRFYDRALSEKEVHKICAECPSQWEDPFAVETVGRVPAYWYTFNGQIKSRGADDLIEGENYYAAHKKPSVSSYETLTSSRKGGVCPSCSGSWFNYGKIDGGSSFTVCYTGSLGPNDRGVLFALGSGGSSSNIALCRKSDSSVMVVRWNADSSYEEIVSAPVAKGGGYSHPYCIRYLAEQKKVELYVDGLKWGEGSFDGLVGTCPYQLCGVYGGNYHGLSGVGTPVWEDFRFYREALSSEEIATMARELPCSWENWIPYDIAVMPKYWYTFTETAAVKRGLEDMKIGYSWDKKAFASSGNCVFARKGRGAATAISPDFSEMFDTTGNFTLVLGARMGVKQAGKDRGILFSLGDSSSANNMALCVTQSGEVLLSRWEKSPETKRFDLIGPVSGYDSSQFHSYAIAWDGTTLSLYVDGHEVGTSTNFASPTDKICGFGSIYGGNCAWMDDGKFALEDFRLYSQALTADEIAKIAAHFSVWPNGALVWNGGESGIWDMETANWLSWDATNWMDQRVAFTAGASALFDTPVVSLSAAAGLTASAVRFEADATIAFGANLPTVPVVTVAEGVKVVPSGIVKREKPGIACFRGVTEAVVPEDKDEFGNAWYLDGTNLCYGQFAPGMLLLLR